MPLTSLWLRFPAERPLVFQSFSGFASRGVFFEMLRSYDEEWAHLLHSGGGIAPYSTTPIIAHDGRRSQVVYRHLPACLASLRICLLEHELSKAFLDILLSGSRSSRTWAGTARLASAWWNTSPRNTRSSDGQLRASLIGGRP